MKGAPELHTYLKYDHYERAVIREQVQELIEEHNAQLED